MKCFDGREDLDRRWRVENGNTEDFDVFVNPYQKTALTYAVQMFEPFEVVTPEGVMIGKVGDWIAIGVHGEMYPVDATVFKETYRFRERERV